MWDCATASQRLRTDGNVFEPGTWHFVVGTYDGSQSRVYYDGELVASRPASGSIDLTNATIRVGCEVWKNHSFWQGYIDEIRIYDRAISESEIQSLYNEGDWTGE